MTDEKESPLEAALRRAPLISCELNVAAMPLGEIHMGSEAWGLSIAGKQSTFTALSNHPVLVGSANWTDRVMHSRCGDYLIVEGAFFTFVLSLGHQTLSLYKATLRDDTGTWCEETPIFGEETQHLNGANGKHYYVQFPFIPDEEFWPVFRTYEQLRLAQIAHLRRA